MFRTERVAIEEQPKRRILEVSMRSAFCQTHVLSPRQLPTHYDDAVSTREYQSDQPSQKLLNRLLALSSSEHLYGNVATDSLLRAAFPSCASFLERSSPSRVRSAEPTLRPLDCSGPF